jgi:hypothetical protein
MTEQEILKGIKQYFDIKELVGEATYTKWGERSWRFLDFRLLHTIYVIRRALDKLMYANNWDIGGDYDERGLRTNVQEILQDKTSKKRLYLSAHVLGKALDFIVQGMTSEEVRNWIIANQHILPYKIRLEHKKDGKPISWVHLDIIWEEHNPKVYLFDVN